MAIRGSGGITARQREMLSRMPDWYFTYSSVNGSLHLGIFALLLVAGILLIRRRPVACNLHVIFAVFNLAQTLAAVGVVAFLFRTIVESYSLSPSAQKLMLPMLPCAFILIAAYPVFLLVWFFRRRIREEVNSWKLPREQV